MFQRLKLKSLIHSLVLFSSFLTRETYGQIACNPPVWAQEAYIKASNNDANDYFGNSVSLDGDTLAVAAIGEDSNQTTITNGANASADDSTGASGAVYVYKRAGTIWAQEAYIKASNNDFGDYFGWSVSLSGDTLAVSAVYEDSNQTTITNGSSASGDNSNENSGAVYVYKRTGATWAQEAYIKASNNDADDNFGISVSLSGDTLAVGAHLEDSNQTTITNGSSASTDNSNLESGAVYVYKRTGVTWAQEAYIKASNNDAQDWLGWSVSLDGDSLAVGAHLEDSNQTTITNGSSASTDNSNLASGAVFVYKRAGVNWAQEAYIKASNNDASDYFGISVSLSGDTLAVGARYEDSNQTTITNGSSASGDNSNTDSGAVYMYKRTTGGNWVQEAYIKASNNDADDRFGESVSLSGDTLVVATYLEDSNQTTITNGSSASADNSNTDSGAVYVFKRSGPIWTQEAYIKSSNNDAGDGFGDSVSLSGDTLAVGARDEDSNQTTITNGSSASGDNSNTESGAVYVYKRGGGTVGALRYSVDDGEIQFCNGSQWVTTKGTQAAATADTAGKMQYNNGSGEYQFNDGTSWYSMKGANKGSCVGTTAGSLRKSGTDLQFCDGTNWFSIDARKWTWTQEAYIKAVNNDAGDDFGFIISLKGDTLAVGARYEASRDSSIINGTTASTNNQDANTGAVYVYRRAGAIWGSWSQEAYIKADNSDPNDEFGSSISLNGETLAVGAPKEQTDKNTIVNGPSIGGGNQNDKGTENGAVYVYKRTGTAWAQEAFIKSSNNGDGDWFGFDVSIDGDTLAVSAVYEDSNQTTITNGSSSSADDSTIDSGAVYVYKRTGTTWAQEAYIKTSNGDGNDFFGISVFINADTLAVTTYAEDSNQSTITNGPTASADNNSINSGAVYIYKRTGTSWAQEAYIKTSNNNADDLFGRDVSLDGDTLAVGAEAEDSSQSTITNGTSSSTDNSNLQSGAVYVYKRTGTSWAQEAYIKASNNDANDYFGFSISLDGDTLAVGTIYEDSDQTQITNGDTAASTNNLTVDSGAVYVYKRTGTTWLQEAYIKASNNGANDNFGWSVSLDGDLLAVSTPNEDSNQTTITNGTTAGSINNSNIDSGAVYIYKRTFGSGTTGTGPLSCPTGFLPVAGNATLGTSDFCVMQYEAKDSGGNAVSQASGNPWVSLNTAAAQSACEGMTEGGFSGTFTLISNPEWMTIARDLEGVTTNWSSGVVGTGDLARGMSAATGDDGFENTGVAPSTGASCLYNTAANTCASTGTHKYRRTLYLSNGSEIWDFAGNIAEWVDWDSGSAGFTTGPTDATGGLQELTTLSGSVTANDLQSSGGYTSSQQAGRWVGGTGGAALRGGYYGSGLTAGAFALVLFNAPTVSDATIGFRCVYRP